MANLEGLSENEQLAKITETYKRLIALDFDNRNIEDIETCDKNSISGIKRNIQDYKNNNLSEGNLNKINKISNDLKDFETDAKINNISTDFHKNFEANIPKEGEFGFALAYEKLNPPITGFNDYIINSYIHYVSVVNGGWTDKNLVILEGEVYGIELINKKWEISEKPLDNFAVKDFKIIEKREGMNEKQKKADAKQFDDEKKEKYGIEDNPNFSKELLKYFNLKYGGAKTIKEVFKFMNKASKDVYSLPYEKRGDIFDDYEQLGKYLIADGFSLKDVIGFIEKNNEELTFDNDFLEKTLKYGLISDKIEKMVKEGKFSEIKDSLGGNWELVNTMGFGGTVYTNTIYNGEGEEKTKFLLELYENSPEGVISSIKSAYYIDSKNLLPFFSEIYSTLSVEMQEDIKGRYPSLTEEEIKEYFPD